MKSTGRRTKERFFVLSLRSRAELMVFATLRYLTYASALSDVMLYNTGSLPFLTLSQASKREAQLIFVSRHKKRIAKGKLIPFSSSYFTLL